MKVVAISDTHGLEPEPLDIPECDVLLHCGDVSPVHDDHEIHSQRHYFRESFLPWLEAAPAEDIIWIAGNHDFFTQDPSFKVLLEECSPDVHYLCDSSVEVQGKKFYGSPWVPNLPSWAWHATTEQFERIADDFDRDADVVLLHGPPYNFGDLDYVHGAGPVGAFHTEKALHEVNPKLVVCGHIHQGFGRHVIDGLEINNVSWLDEYYRPTHDFVEFQL